MPRSGRRRLALQPLASVSGQPSGCRCPVPRHPPGASARLQRQEHAALTMT